MSPDMIRNLVIWVPTGLFILTILLGFLVGVIRGFRKSLILFIHAIIIFIGLAIAYSIIVNSASSDKGTFDTINSILASTAHTSLQKLTNTSESCASLKDVIAELIVKNAGEGEGYALVIADNGEYLATLVNLVYHLVFFILFYILYFILLFLMFIIYLIAYPERRYKKKKNKRYENLETKFPYNKHALLGGVVGLVRGFIVAVLSLSVIGTVLYIAYGDGKTKSEKYTFDNKQVSDAYGIYDSMSDYGTSGIFKIATAVKDGDNFPYYLYVANYILSGNYTDASGKTTNFYLTKELGNYTAFANKSMKLMLKYDDQKLISKYISNVSNKTATQEELMNALATIMAKEGFQQEFDKLVDDFKGESFISNMALSFVTSVVKYRDELHITDNFKDNEQAIELINVIFEGDEGLKISNLLTENDTKLLMKSVVKILATTTGEYQDEMDRYLALASASIPYITELSILNDANRKKEINPTLERLYNYLSTLNTKDNSNSNLSNNLSIVDYANKTYNANLSSESIDWANELKTLLNASKSAIQLFRTVYDPKQEVVDCIFNIFATTDQDLLTKQNTYYDDITNALVNSKLFGAAMSISFVKEGIDTALGAINENIALPSNISYANTYKADGTVDEYGEVYYLLTAVKKLLKNDGKQIYKTLTSKEMDNAELINVLKKLSAKADGESIIDTLVNSKIVQYIVSGIVLNLDSIAPDVNIIIPNSEIIVDPDNNEVLAKETLSTLVDSLSNVLDNVQYIKESDTVYVNIKGILDTKDTLLENNILHATIVYYLVENISSIEQIKIPTAYLEAATKVSLESFNNNIWKTNNEISDMFTALDELFGISTSEDDFDLENAFKNIMTSALNLTSPSSIDPAKTKLDVIYDVDILVASFTSVLDGVLTDDILPQTIRESALVKETDDIIGKYYKSSEVAAVINSAKELAITTLDNFDASSITDAIATLNEESITNPDKTKIEVLYDSAIVRHAITKPVDNVLTAELINQDVRDSSLIKATELGIKYYKKEEVSNVIKFIDELEIKSFNDINADVIKGKVLELNDKSTNDTTKTKLQVLYSSNILTSALATQLDKALTGDDPLVPATIVNSTLVKESNDVYTYYKEAEVSAIINSLKDLNISNIDNIVVDNIKNEIFNINKASIVDITKTKLDVLYESAIIRHALTKPLDDALTTDILATEVRDSEIVKDTEIEVNYYKKIEISNLIKSLNEIGISNIDNVNTDTIKNEVLNLNEVSTTDSTKTKLQVLYSSNIISNAFTKPLDDALTADILSLEVRNSNLVKETVIGTITKYKETEIKTLIDALKELGITDIDNIDTNTVKNEILNLNSLAITNTSATKLHVIYSSNIMANAFTKPLDDTLTSTILPTEVRDSNLVKEDVLTISRKYQETEIANLINAVKELGITDVNNIDKENIININMPSTTSSADLSRLDVIYLSVIIRNAMTEPMDETVSQLVNDDVKNSDATKVAEDGLSVKYYHKYEIKAIINSAKELGIDDLSTTIELNKVKNEILNLNNAATTDNTVTKLDVLYSSVIIKYSVAKELDKQFVDGSVIVNNEVLALSKSDTTDSVKITGKYYYTKEEVKRIVDALSDSGLGVSNLDSISSISADSIKKLAVLNTTGAHKDETRLSVVYSSYIISDILSTKINEALDSNTAIVNPISAKEVFLTTTVKHYKEAEVLELIKFLNNLSSTATLDSIDFGSISLNPTLKSNILSSEVLYYTVSKNIIENTSIITPASLVDTVDANKVINDQDEMDSLLDAVITFAGGDITSNKTPKLDDAKDNVNIVTASLIMRATVSDLVTASGSTSLYVLDSDVTLDVNNNTSEKILIFTATELQNIITSLSLVNNTNSYEFDFDIVKFKAMSSADKVTFVNSNTARIILSDLLDALHVYMSFDAPTHHENVYDKMNYPTVATPTDKIHYNASEIIEIVNSKF